MMTGASAGWPWVWPTDILVTRARALRSAMHAHTAAARSQSPVTSSPRQPVTNASIVAAAIRAALVRGDYAPGQRLVEAELCSTYDASRATVREALRQLASDGLVELEPHKAARVRLVTLDEAIELAEVRLAVESLIAAKAAERITPEGAAELRRLGQEMRSAVTAFDPLGSTSKCSRRTRPASSPTQAVNAFAADWYETFGTTGLP
jgi:DNA-binding FadR family transcriptional regulator